MAGNRMGKLNDIVNSYDCKKFRDFLKDKFAEYKHQGRLGNASFVVALCESNRLHSKHIDTPLYSLTREETFQLLHQIPNLIRKPDPSTKLGVAEIEDAIHNWECERLRKFVQDQVRHGEPHPRSKRGE